YTATRGGPVIADPGHVSVRAEVNTDRRRAVGLAGGFNVTKGRDGAGEVMSVNSTLSLRPSSRLEVELEPRYSTQTDGDQYVASTSVLPWEPTYGRRYLFGELKRKTVSMEARVNWTFSPRLSFQLFAQPLLSSGHYVAYKQLTAPRTFDFDTFQEGTYSEVDGQGRCEGGRICARRDEDGGTTRVVDFDGDGEVDYGFGDRDFNVRSLIGNAVLRWEYRPGSTIFFVWQRRQAASADLGDFRFGRDLDALLGAPAEDRFIIKVNYWLGM
ncbi:MAG TPA: DUF5916 domain-containing protein, partial [Longimicrobiales bacterium]|nr:DUF5916 domain-containing protein [Longimicrobiales bacterium]